MKKDTYEAGYFEDRTPFVTFGSGDRHLLILEDLRVEHDLPQGLALQGLRDSWKDLGDQLKITLLSRPKSLKEGTTQKDFALDVVTYLQAYNSGPVEILAHGISVATALEIQRWNADLISRFWFVSGTPKLSDSGRVLFEKLLEAGRRHQWSKVHRILAGTMFKSPWGKALGGALAALFSSDLGKLENPWDFLVTLQAVMSWDPQPRELDVPMNIWVGMSDPLYQSEDWDSWLDVNPSGVLEMRDESHGLMKVMGDEIRAGILRG